MILTDLPENLELTYAHLNLNVLLGNVEFENVTLTSLNLEANKTAAEISLETLHIKAISYWSLLKNKQLKTDNIYVEHARVKVFKKTSDDVRFSIKEVSFTLSEFVTDSLLVKKKIPFKYTDLDLELTHLYFDLGSYETLKIDALSYKKATLNFSDLAIASKWNKTILSKKLIKEHDYVDFKVAYGASEGFRVKNVNDSLKISTSNFVFNTSELHLFRDKLITNDTSKKELYATTLKKLPIQLDINSFLIDDLNIFYSERVDKDVEPVSISFENLEAKIQNLSNINTKNTTIEATTALMGKAPLKFNWDFNVFDPSAGFNASIVLKDLDALTINPFLESQANVRAVGRINEMYFTIHGNNEKSAGDMKMKYEDFKFTILNEDQLGINKTLSTLVNIITNDGSKTDENGYRYGEIKTKRDPTKSFFNYLWLNTKNGLKTTLTGNGEK
ncbi:hypothetical protein [Lacinutrix undariae]